LRQHQLGAYHFIHCAQPVLCQRRQFGLENDMHNFVCICLCNNLQQICPCHQQKGQCQQPNAILESISIIDSISVLLAPAPTCKLACVTAQGNSRSGQLVNMRTSGCERIHFSIRVTAGPSSMMFLQGRRARGSA